MGQRGGKGYERQEKDKYRTMMSAVVDVVEYMPPEVKFIEPCAGDGRLIRHLESFEGLNCVQAFDIAPDAPHIPEGDMLTMPFSSQADAIITNPPWRRDLLHALMDRIIDERMPAWLLFDHNWLATKQTQPYSGYIRLILPIGRHLWFDKPPPGKDKHEPPKDDAMWVFMDGGNPGPTTYLWRTSDVTTAQNT